MSAGRLPLALAACLAFAGLGQPAGGAERSLVLDEMATVRQYYRFGPDRVSREALEREGQALLGPRGLRALQTQTEDRLKRAGTDPAKVDWRDHVVVRFFFDSESEYVAPAPPADWAAPGFDDGSWVLERGPIHAELAREQPLPKGPGWTRDDLDRGSFSSLGVRAFCLRFRFVVSEPAQASDLTLRLVYRGGVRALVNGEEVARGHLAQGETPETPGDDYPKEAYLDQPELRDRVLGPVAVPPRLLRKGANVLAIEVHASRLHPVALSMKLATHNHKVRQGMVGLWRHADLSKLDLRSASPAVVSGLARPAGVQAWARDIHHRVESTEFLAAGFLPGTVRFVGARNGTFGAQVVVGTDRPLADVQVSPGKLVREGGGEELAASVQAYPMAPYPADGFTEKNMGDERSLGATFPDTQLLARWEGWEDPAKPCIFDHIEPPGACTVPAGACRPVWLSLRIPADAAPGTYRGTIQITARGAPPASLPVEAEVLPWRLPDPRDFRTVVACEENPYGVAKQYGVPLWSDEHFRLLEASFRQLARVGDDWLNVPVLSRTEFGNRDDSMIRWTRRKDGSLAFDYAILDRYLDLAVKEWGPPRVINFAVMQCARSALNPPAPPVVRVRDEATGQTADLALDGPGVTREEKRARWRAFATSLYDHMKARGLAGSMYWGYPCDQEADPELKTLLAQFTPGVYWTAAPHEMLWNAVYAKDARYRVIVIVRYQPGQRSLAAFRTDQGWKSQVLRLLHPRTGGNFFAIHTTSTPFAYRCVVDQAVAHGHSGVARIGADEWAAVHYDGMVVPQWVEGVPVLFTLWPGKGGAEPGARFEALIEGIQETEARIFLEQALEGGKRGSPRTDPAALARRVREALTEHLEAVGFLGGTLCVHELERYSFGWQERSRALYQVAGEVAAAMGK